MLLIVVKNEFIIIGISLVWPLKLFENVCQQVLIRIAFDYLKIPIYIIVRSQLN